MILAKLFMKILPKYEPWNFLSTSLFPDTWLLDFCIKHTKIELNVYQENYFQNRYQNKLPAIKQLASRQTHPSWYLNYLMYKNSLNSLSSRNKTCEKEKFKKENWCYLSLIECIINKHHQDRVNFDKYARVKAVFALLSLDRSTRELLNLFIDEFHLKIIY